MPPPAAEPPAVLLVQGDPPLAGPADAAYEGWASDLLADATRALPRASVVLSDGLAGPPVWAREVAQLRGLRVLELRADGHRWVGGERQAARWRAAHLRGDWRAAQRAGLWEAAARAAAAGHTPRLLDVRRDDAPPPPGDPVEAGWAAAGWWARRERFDPAAVPAPGAWDQVWLDVETSGFDAARDVAVEIGAVHADRAGRFPFRRFDARIVVPVNVRLDTRFVDYSPGRWHDARPAAEVAAALQAWLPPRFRLCNHNPRFDQRFVRALLARAGLPEPGWLPEVIDTCRLARGALKGVAENAQLGTVCDALGVAHAHRHRALADAEAARACYLAILARAAT